MALALRLAKKGLYTTAPNPRVGCVLVKQGQIVGQAWHEKTGEAHAEPQALAQAGDRAQGTTAYVTLEPCAHQGRTAPCADALIQAGVSRVVVAMEDPFPKVAGQGIARLRAAGIQVDTGLMRIQAEDLNPGFTSRILRKRPWVRVKLAMSLDGRTAMANGDSNWITGPEARQDVHHWRARASGILTGMGTVLKDDPRLNVRLENHTRVDMPTPVRLVLDADWRLPSSAKLFQQSGPVWQFGMGEAKACPGVDRAVSLSGTSGRVNLHELMAYLAEMDFNELHTEAGAVLSGALLEAGLVDELLIYMAPSLMGSSSRPLLNLPSVQQLSDRYALKWQSIRQIGPDLRLLLRLSN